MSSITISNETIHEIVRRVKHIIQNWEFFIVLPMLMLIIENESLELLSASFLVTNQVLKG
jgi:hypothetical protein